MSEELTHKTSLIKCPKCSAPLRSDIYFCTYCAEGWRNPTQGLETTPEPVWDAETRIRLRARGAYEACYIYLIALLLGIIFHEVLGGQEEDASELELILISLSVGVASLWVIFRNFEEIKKSLNWRGLISPWFMLSAFLLLPTLAINHFYHSLLIRETSVVMGKSVYLFADGFPWLAGLFFCIFPAVFEELVFRSYVYPLLNRALTLVWAAVISSALFATMHFTFWSWPYHFLLGLLLCFTATKTRSVFPCVLLHFAHNYAVLFLLPRF